MSLPDYFFISECDGCLYDTRTPTKEKNHGNRRQQHHHTQDL